MCRWVDTGLRPGRKVLRLCENYVGTRRPVPAPRVRETAIQVAFRARPVRERFPAWRPPGGRSIDPATRPPRKGFMSVLSLPRMARWAPVAAAVLGSAVVVAPAGAAGAGGGAVIAG